MFDVESPLDRPGRTDAALLAVIILLWGLGIVTLYITSANYGGRLFGDTLYFVKRQLRYSIIGFPLMFIFMALPLETVRKLLPVIAIGSLGLCLLVFLPGIGVERNGARRWIRIPVLGTFQPSETAKLAVVLFLANIFAKQHESRGGGALRDGGAFSAEFEADSSARGAVAAPVAGVLLFVLVIFLQKDFSSGVFMLAVGIMLFFAVGMRIGWFLSVCVLAIPAVLLFVFLEPYRVYRLIAFVRPDYDLHGLNYQMNMARLAINAGGFFGEGIGSGLTRINRIPEVQADYIFAGWAEAMGFAGVLAYFALLAFFAWRGFRTAVGCAERFGAYTAFGIVTCIVFQSLLNCGVVCSALPSTGIPLPFFSSGGSSLLITFVMCGIVLQVSRKNMKEPSYE